MRSMVERDAPGANPERPRSYSLSTTLRVVPLSHEREDRHENSEPRDAFRKSAVTQFLQIQ